MMNLTSKKNNLKAALLTTTVLASIGGGILMANTSSAQASPSEKERQERVRHHCRQAVFPSPGENYKGYQKCLEDRGVYNKDQEWWKNEVRRHCENVYYPLGIGKGDCYKDRGFRGYN